MQKSECDVFDLFSEIYTSAAQEEISLQEYLLACRDDKSMYATAQERMVTAIGDPTLMNASMLASLKPGGFLAVIDFPPDSAESADPDGRDDGEQHGVTSATVARELGEAGFEVVSVEKGDGSDRYMVVARRPGS